MTSSEREFADPTRMRGFHAELLSTGHHPEGTLPGRSHPVSLYSSVAPEIPQPQTLLPTEPFEPPLQK